MQLRAVYHRARGRVVAHLSKRQRRPQHVASFNGANKIACLGLSFRSDDAVSLSEPRQPGQEVRSGWSGTRHVSIDCPIADQHIDRRA